MEQTPLSTRIIYGAVAVLVVMFAIAVGTYAGHDSVGKPASDVSGYTTEGAAIAMTDHAGKVVVLDFWATWCPPCVGAVPKMIALQNQHPDDVQIIGISADVDRQALVNFEAVSKMNYPTIFDGANDLIRQYDVNLFPTVIVIDRQGVVRYRGHGEGLEAAIQSALAG